jgi:Spinocerebellar ataxia type 10 protein domain
LTSPLLNVKGTRDPVYLVFRPSLPHPVLPCPSFLSIEFHSHLPQNQNMLRDSGGLSLCLSHCATDFRLPFAREWGLVSVRNICEARTRSNNKNFYNHFRYLISTTLYPIACTRAYITILSPLKSSFQCSEALKFTLSITITHPYTTGQQTEPRLYIRTTAPQGSAGRVPRVPRDQGADGPPDGEDICDILSTDSSLCCYYCLFCSSWYCFWYCCCSRFSLERRISIPGI